MNFYRINIFFFLFLLLNITSLFAAEPFYSGEVALYSSRTGKLITSLSYSVEINSSEGAADFLLRFGNKAGIVRGNGEKLSLWIFNKKIDAKQFAKNNSSIEVGDIQSFDVFCRNSKAEFAISGARKIETFTSIPFDINADSGSKVELYCNIYIASHKKKKTIIDDEAQLKIEFLLPKIVRDKDGGLITLEVDKSLTPEPLTPAEIEEQKLMREDSIRQIKIKQLHLFISETDKEIANINIQIDTLLQNKVYEKHQIDSLEKFINVLKKKVDFQEKVNIALFPYDETLMNNFTEFNTKYSDTLSKIEELKVGPAKKNWLMILAIAATAMFAGMFILQIWNQIKSKRQQLKINKQMFKANKKSELDNLDDNDLGKI